MEGNMSQVTNFYTPSQASIEALQGILSEQLGAAVTFEEAEEVGIQLISFYECLARERNSAEESGDGRTD
jgi:hypothetical protein